MGDRDDAEERVLSLSRYTYGSVYGSVSDVLLSFPGGALGEAHRHEEGDVRVRRLTGASIEVSVVLPYGVIKRDSRRVREGSRTEKLG